MFWNERWSCFVFKVFARASIKTKYFSFKTKALADASVKNPSLFCSLFYLVKWTSLICKETRFLDPHDIFFHTSWCCFKIHELDFQNKDNLYFFSFVLFVKHLNNLRYPNFIPKALSPIDFFEFGVSISFFGVHSDSLLFKKFCELLFPKILFISPMS